MYQRITTAVNHRPSSQIYAKFFDGTTWTRCCYEHLRNDIKLTSDFFLKLTREGGELIGFSISPCLALPALILSATLSSRPFVFLKSERLPSTFLQKLRLRWLIVDSPLTDERFKLFETFELRSTLFMVYQNLDVSLSEKVGEYQTYLYATTTSGSTGAPKVVRVPEESILPNVLDFSFKLGLTSAHGVLLSTALTFDPAILEFFLAVINGAPLIIPSKDVTSSPRLLLRAIQEGEAAFYQTTPSLFRLWSLKEKRELLGHESNLKALVLGGERFPSLEEVKKWEPRTNVRIYNTYGLSEVSCWATLNLAFPNDDWKNFSKHGLDIGECLSETQIISNKDSSSGLFHLMIGSSTRVCAIENETFNELRIGKPIFRSTGDVFKIVDGKHYFCWRSDSIVKRLGNKVNVSLIEQTSHEIGLDAATSVRSSGNDDFRILLFVVGKRHSKDVVEKLECLKKILPRDHWLDEIDFLDSLPLSPHGKLDRTALASYIPLKPECSYFTFVEFWNLFTSGSKRTELTDKDKGFVASGGNSFTAILFINSLRDVGFPDNSDLLLSLLKDEPFRRCWSLYPADALRTDRKRKKKIKEGASKRYTEDISEMDALATPQKPFIGNPESEVTAELSLSNADSPVQTKPVVSYSNKSVRLTSISMVLKGDVSPPNSIPVDPVWFSECQTVQKVWSVDLLKCIDASPLAIVNIDSYLIVGSHSGLVVALKCDSGDVISQSQLPDRIEASACLSSDQSSYYIGCYDGNVYAISVAKGDIAWTFQTQDLVKSTCVLYLGKLFLGSYDKYIYAITEGGVLLWKQLVGPVTIPVLPFESSIIVGTLNGFVLRLSSDDGTVLSRTEIGTPLFSNLKFTSLPGHPRCVLVSPVEGPIQWRDVETLSEVDKLYIGGQKFAAPVISNDGLTIIASGKAVHCLHFLTTLWTYDFESRIVSTPFVVGSRVVVITIDGSLHILDMKGGLLCAHRLPGEVFSSPVVVGSRVLVGCRDNNFYCLDVSA